MRQGWPVCLKNRQPMIFFGVLPWLYFCFWAKTGVFQGKRPMTLFQKRKLKQNKTLMLCLVGGKMNEGGRLKGLVGEWIGLQSWDLKIPRLGHSSDPCEVDDS